MILPGSTFVTILLLALSLFCWGSWANTFKLAGKWRFELYYFDFAMGALATAILIALTFGSLGWDGFSFIDDLRIAGKHQELYGFLSGCIFNLGNMLLLGAVSVTGMAIAFPVALGLAIGVAGIFTLMINGTGNAVMLGLGCAALLGSVIFAFQAWKGYSKQLLLGQIRQGKTKSTKVITSGKGVMLALLGGLVMGCCYPMIEMARNPDLGLGPYGLGFAFALGIFASSFVYGLFFANLPVAGDAVDVKKYLRGSRRQHLLGMLGGGLLVAGAIASFVAAKADRAAAVRAPIGFGIVQASPLVALACGLLLWKELGDADGSVRTLVAAEALLFVMGLGALTMAMAYGAAS